MNFLTNLTQLNLVDMIESTRRHLYLCLPSIHPELARAILQLNQLSNDQEVKINIHILVDFDAQTFRQGYGDFNSVELLLNSKLNIKSIKDNRISFIINENIGFFLFLESRNMVPANKSTLNAIRIDPITIVRLKQYFFYDEIVFDFKAELKNAFIEESEILKNTKDLAASDIAVVTEITTSDIQIVKSDIENNPPLNPDYQRIVHFYSSKFQYVKLKFDGANLQHRRIIIPPKALPISDAALKERLNTKVNLFYKPEEMNDFMPLIKLKEKVNLIREQYLKKVKSREESLLEKVKKEEFLFKVKEIEKSLYETQINLLNLTTKLIAEAKQSLLIELKDFYLANSKVLFKDKNQNSFFLNDKEYVNNFAESEATNIINRIPWPSPHELLLNMKIEVQFSDITYEDLKNPDFAQELKECGLIDESDLYKLAEFRKALEIK